MCNEMFFIILVIAAGLVLLSLLIGHVISTFEQHTDDIVQLQLDNGYLKGRVELQAAAIANLNRKSDKVKKKVVKTQKKSKGK